MSNFRPWRNMLSIHHRLMAHYLRKRGWVVFYLDEHSRWCDKSAAPCWLELYQEGERRR